MFNKHKIVIGVIVLFAGLALEFQQLNEKFLKQLVPSCDHLLGAMKDPSKVAYIEKWVDDFHSEMMDPANYVRRKTLTEALKARTKSGEGMRFSRDEEPMFEWSPGYMLGDFEIRKKVDWELLGFPTDVGWRANLVGFIKRDSKGQLILDDLGGVAFAKGNFSAYLVSFSKVSSDSLRFIRAVGEIEVNDRIQVNCK